MSNLDGRKIKFKDKCTYYTYFESVGVVSGEYNEETDRIIVSNFQYPSSSIWVDTEDEAKLKHYISSSRRCQDIINSANGKIKKEQNNLKKLDEEFSYLIDIFPEEFL